MRLDQELKTYSLIKAHNLMIRKVSILLTLFVFVAWTAGYAQEENASNFKDNLRIYKTKKHQSEFGVHAGNFFINGDVKPQLGLGVGIHYRRAIDFAFSWRLDVVYGQASGIDPTPVAAASLPSFPSEYGPADLFYPNFQSTNLNASLQGLLSLNPFNFNQQLKKWNMYLIFGVGVNSSSVDYDALTDGAAYDFSSIANLDPNNSDDRKEIVSELKNILDGDYETEGYSGIPTDQATKLRLHGTVGFGIARRISKNFSLGLEHQLIMSAGQSADYLDGYSGSGGRKISDVMNYTSLRASFDIGKTSSGDVSDPLYWTSAIDLLAEDMAAVAQRVDESLRDSDGDGVLDMVDEDPNTPEGASVDTRGNLLDSDRDGVADYMDDEPHSPQNYPVDAKGVAQVPDPGYTTEDDVNRIVDAKMAEFKATYGENMNWFLPMVNFAFDSYTVRSSEYAKLHSVASVMMQNKNIKIVITGFADRPGSECYNQVLSYNRAESVKNYLTSKYGISADRLMLAHQGENDAILDTNGRSAMNRRVEMRTAGSGDSNMSMPDCGVKNAGKGQKEYEGSKQGY